METQKTEVYLGTEWGEDRAETKIEAIVEMQREEAHVKKRETSTKERFHRWTFFLIR